MREVFNFQRTGIYWWGLLTALVFLIPGQWLRSLVSFLRTPNLIQPSNPPFTWFENAGSWIDAGTRAAVGRVKFDAAAGLVYIGNIGVANMLLAIILAVVLTSMVFIFYLRAIKTHGIADDLIAMVLIYAMMRVLGAAAAGWKIPVIDFLHNEEPRSYLLILTVFMLLLMIAGKAAMDSRVFFKILFEGLLVWFLILPIPTVQAFAYIIEIPVWINYILQSEPTIRNYYAMVVAVWAIFGLFLAGTSIYSAGRPPPTPQVNPADDLEDAIRLLGKRKSKFRG